MKKKLFYRSVFAAMSAAALLLSASCTNIFSPAQAEAAQTADGMCSLNVNASYARSAYPSALPQLFYYAVIHNETSGTYCSAAGTSGDPVYLKNSAGDTATASPVFLFPLQTAGWNGTITLYGFSSGYNGSSHSADCLVSGSGTFTVAAGSKTAAAAVNVSLNGTYKDTAKGSISLKISLSDDLSAEIKNKDNITLECTNEMDDALLSLDASLSGTVLTLSASEVAAGTYWLALKFSDGANLVATDYVTQTISVFPGLTTDKWYAASGSEEETLSVNCNTGTIYYVCGDNPLRLADEGKDTNSGLSAGAPLKTVAAAAAKCIAYDTAYTIYVDGTTTETAQIVIGDGNGQPVVTVTIKSFVPAVAGSEINPNATIARGTGEDDNNMSVILVEENATLNMMDITIDGSNVENDGNGACIDMGGTGCTLTNCVIQNGTLDTSRTNLDGGGIYAKSGTLTLDKSKVRNCTSVRAGGGIYSAGTLTLTGCTIQNCKVLTAGPAGQGGGLYIFNGSVTMSGGTISGNTAEGSSAGYGGGVYNNGTFNMSGSAVVDSDNDVYLASGKTITVTGALTGTAPVATITPEDCTTNPQVIAADGVLLAEEVLKFSTSDTNYIIDDAGYICKKITGSSLSASELSTRNYIFESTTISDDSVSISSDTIIKCADGVTLTTPPITIASGNTLEFSSMGDVTTKPVITSSNTSSSLLTVSGGTFTANNVEIKGNTSASNVAGACLNISGGTANLTNVDFTGNIAGGTIKGGCIYAIGTSSVTYNGGTFTAADGSTGGNATGFLAYAADSSTLRISNVEITRNTVKNLIYTQDSVKLSLSKCKVTDNTLSNSSGNSGLLLTSSSENTENVIEECTVSNNTFDSASQGYIGQIIYYSGSGGVLTIDKSTFSSNTGTGNNGAIIAVASGATIKVTGGTYSENEIGNTADSSVCKGGAFYCAGTLSISKDSSNNETQIKNNKLSSGQYARGPAIYIKAAGIVTTDTETVITGNTKDDRESRNNQSYGQIYCETDGTYNLVTATSNTNYLNAE